MKYINCNLFRQNTYLQNKKHMLTCQGGDWLLQILITSPVVSWRECETPPPQSTVAQLSFFAQPRSSEDLSLRGGLLLSSARICLHLVDGLGLFSWTYPLSTVFSFFSLRLYQELYGFAQGWEMEGWCRTQKICPMHCQVTSSLVGVGVARPVVGSTGETWLRWRSPSPVASSRRSGGSTGLPRFEVLDQMFLPPASGRSFIGGASAWFFLPLWLTAVSLACGLAFAVLLGGGGFPRGY